MSQDILQKNRGIKISRGIALIIFIAVCILGIFLISCKGFTRDKPDFKMTAAELYREYKENPSSAHKYNGRKIRVTGIVGSSMRNGHYQLIVQLYPAKDAPVQYGLWCIVDEEKHSEKEVVKLRKGQEITIQGICTELPPNTFPGAFQLEECWFSKK